MGEGELPALPAESPTLSEEMSAPMLDAWLLSQLRCPQTQQALTEAPAALLVDRQDRDGRPLEAALLRADGAVLYPIRSGIPVLLAEEAIPT